LNASFIKAIPHHPQKERMEKVISELNHYIACRTTSESTGLFRHTNKNVQKKDGREKVEDHHHNMKAS